MIGDQNDYDKTRITGVKKEKSMNSKTGFLKGHWRNVAMLLIVYDIVAINMAYFMGLWLRFDCKFSIINPVYLTAWEKFIPFYTVFCLIVFWRARLFKSLWKYASYSELMHVIAASIITGLFHTVFITILFGYRSGRTNAHRLR